MKVSNLKPEQVYPNYRKLCEALGEPVNTGNSKICQIHRWKSAFKFRRVGNGYQILEILEDNEEYLELQRVPHNKMCIILLAGFLQLQLSEEGDNPHEITLRKRDIEEVFGLINKRFYSRKDSFEITVAEKEFFSEISYRNRRFTDRVLNSFIELQEFSDFPYCKVTRILKYRTVTMGFNELKTADPLMEIQISQIFYKLMDDFEAESQRELFLKDRLKSFYARFNNILLQRWGIVYTEHCVMFTTSRSLLVRLISDTLTNSDTLEKIHLKSNQRHLGKLVREYENLTKKYEKLKLTNHEEYKTEYFRDMPQELYAEKLRMLEQFISLLDTDFKTIFLPAELRN